MFYYQMEDIIIGRRDGGELGHPPTALLLKNRKEVPFPPCITPGYISGFPDIEINFLDVQVLNFVKMLCDYLATQGRIRICFSGQHDVLNDRQHKQALVDQLFTIFRNAAKNDLKLLSSFKNLMQNVKEMDTEMEAIHLTHLGETDIPMLMQMLATHRADGKQRVIQLQNFEDENLAENIVASIKKEFRASTQPLPQPFLFRFYCSNFTYMPYEEENQQTDETLATINSDANGNYWDICRYPTGPHEEWAADGRSRLKYVSNVPYTYISVNIFEFGLKAASNSIHKEGTENDQKQLEHSVDLDNGIMNDEDEDGTGTEVGLREVEAMAKEMVDKCQVDSARKIGKSKIIICMSVEVWVDVFGFIKRIQLARTICLTCWHLYDICYPRLHGNKVVEHEVQEIIIARRDGGGLGPPSMALLLKDREEVPFPSCPPPSYITAFPDIDINILDHRVLEFLKFTASRMVQNRVWITLDLMKPPEEEHCITVNQLLNIYRDIAANIYLNVVCPVSSLHHTLSNQLSNKMELIELNIKNESDIQTMVKILAIPRTDGHQHVAKLYFEEVEYSLQMLAAIKNEFLLSTQLLPQTFYIRCLHILHIEEENHHREQTDEELIIRTIINRYGNQNWDICRHPAGQHEQWAEDGRRRLEFEPGRYPRNHTSIHMDIFDFGP